GAVDLRFGRDPCAWTMHRAGSRRRSLASARWECVRRSRAEGPRSEGGVEERRIPVNIPRRFESACCCSGRRCGQDHESAGGQPDLSHGASSRRDQPRSGVPRTDGRPRVMGLVLAEFRRILARRSFRLVGAICVVAVLAGGLLVFVESHKSLDASRPQAEQMIAECQNAVQNGPTVTKHDNGGVSIREANHCPTLDQAELLFDKRFHYAETTRATTQNVALPLFF